MSRDLILARNYYEARTYAKENYISGGFIMVYNTNALKGIRNSELHLLPYWTMTKHPNLIERIREELRIFEHPAKGNIIINIKEK